MLKTPASLLAHVYSSVLPSKSDFMVSRKASRVERRVDPTVAQAKGGVLGDWVHDLCKSVLGGKGESCLSPLGLIFFAFIMTYSLQHLVSQMP